VRNFIDTQYLNETVSTVMPVPHRLVNEVTKFYYYVYNYSIKAYHKNHKDMFAYLKEQGCVQNAYCWEFFRENKKVE